jgi:hypothetical protein
MRSGWTWEEPVTSEDQYACPLRERSAPRRKAGRLYSITLRTP